MNKLTQSQQDLAAENHMLIFKMVSKFTRNTGLTYDEIYDSCVNAMIRSVRMYDPERGFKFSTLYGKACENEIIRTTRDRKAQKRIINTVTTSIDKAMYISNDGDDLTLSDMLGKDDHYSVFTHDMIESVWDYLSEKQKACIYLYYYEGKKQREISEILGFTQVHVSRLILTGLDKLKGKLNKEELLIAN